MTLRSIARPEPAEYAEWYAGYIAKVPEENLLDALESNLDELALLDSITEDHAGHRYAPGKWSLRQLVGHLIDGERVFAYRALRFSRQDAASLPGFDENEFVDHAAFEARTLQDLLQEFRACRQANLLMFRGMSPEMTLLSGTASNRPMSVRALACVMAGHLRHHLGVVKAKYL